MQPTPTPARAAELQAALAAVRARIAASTAAAAPAPVLVAVSKYKPAADIAALHAGGQRDFGENYVQELTDKAPNLPPDIRWHFIGHVQSNKAKTVAAIPNLDTLHTLTSIKLATALDKARGSLRPLRVLLQVNTSAEPAKSGLAPLAPGDEHAADAELVALARHVLTACPRLRLAGLMAIGALDNSRAASEGDENADFAVLRSTRTRLEELLAREFSPESWGGALVLSMGMSADYEAAIRAGSGIVRVGSSIFGERPQKGNGGRSHTT